MERLINARRHALWITVTSLISIGALAVDGRADVIQLSTGETLEVQVLELTEDAVRFEHPVLGEMTLSRDVVIVLPVKETPRETQETEDDAPPAEAAVQPTAEAQVEPPADPVAEPESDWAFKLVLGLAATEGNSESANFHTKFTAVRETERRKLAFDASYFVASSDGDRSDNRLSAGVRHDWLNPGSKWFYFAQGRYDLDEFQSWDYRVSAHGGVGYRLIEPPDLNLNVLAGAGAIKEFNSDNDDVRPELLFGVEGEWQIADKHSLVFDSTIYPDLSDVGEYRTLSNLGWSMLIDKESRLSLTAGLQHEYQSQVDPGRDKNDFRLYAGLEMDF